MKIFLAETAITKRNFTLYLDHILLKYERRGSREEKLFRDLYIDFQDEMFNALYKVYNTLQNHANKIFSARVGDRRGYHLEVCLESVMSTYHQREFSDQVRNFYPYVAYLVHRGVKSFGVLIFANGKVQEFEGTDEASVDDIAVYNQLMQRYSWIMVYASHGEEVYNSLKNGILPEGVYVTTEQRIARSYWSLEEMRYLVSFEVNEADLVPTADREYVSSKDTRVRKLKVISTI